MKILIVTQYFWPESFRINQLAVDMQQRGHDVTVLTGIPNYPQGSYFEGYGVFRKRRESYHGVTIKRLPIISRGRHKGLRLIMNYLSFVMSGCLLGPLLCRDKYDVVFVFEPSPITVGVPAMLLKKLKKAKLFFWVQDLWPETLVAVEAVKSKKIIDWLDKLVKWIYSHCDKILVQSQGFIDSICAKGIHQEKIVYFPNSAEAIFQYPIDDNSSTLITDFPDGFTIVFAGNIGTAQSFPTLLEAAKSLEAYTDLHWVILGDGNQFDWLKQQVITRQLTKQVHLLGRKPLASMPAYFAKANVLLASLRKNPIFSLTIPSKVQAYLASGKPIVACLDGESQRVIEQAHAGICVPPENAKQLSTAILQLYQMTADERQILGNNGKHYFQQHFSQKRLNDHLETWLQQAIQEESRGV